MKNLKKYIMVALAATSLMCVSAQQVNTLYFLENAPMRHTINPAFQPVSKGYINFTPLGWMSISSGNNAFTLSDFVMVDTDPTSSTYGKTITALHPNADKEKFLNTLKKTTMVNGELTIGLLNMGFQVNKKGYLTIGVNERVIMSNGIPKSLPDFLFNGGLKNLNGANAFNLTGLEMGGTIYTEVGVGYSHIINDHWTVGGKLKVLMGQAYYGTSAKDISITASTEEWKFGGEMDLNIAAPLNMDYLVNYAEGKTAKEFVDGFGNGSFQSDSIMPKNILSALVPSGYGAAIDLGFTYKPIENLQISAAIVDLGFIYWGRSNKMKVVADSTASFTGVGELAYGDPRFRDENGKFSTGLVMDTVKANLANLLNGFKMRNDGTASLIKMVSARLNVGVDANFWDNRVGVGVVSSTRMYNSRFYEELTFGVAFRPVNWFNIAASYSIFDNGKYSNIGAGLGFMPYDGINLTLTMDYIPTSYAKMPNSNSYLMPDKAKMLNVAMGFSICWGSNRRDKDKDGVYNKIDMCPNTPRGVAVDERGCPLDEDHDGVPDYLDQCLGTPSAAIGFVDSVGCELDTDGDGVEDYRDKCPNTPEAAWGKVDENGCPLDTDGDGVPDYLDQCPDTPEAAWGKVDEKGCPIDTDGDGVPDYLDQCPETPAEAKGLVDEQGCPLDSDHDGVPDYLDRCPNTPEEAHGYVDSVGCPLDTDNDGVADYCDKCPMVPGIEANKGCPEMKREVRQLLQKAMQGIEFETGKAKIKKKSYDLLDKIAETFIANENYIIEVQGHTDNTGKAEVNKKISEQRAQEVMNYLVKKGVPANRMTAVGYGQEKPIADNATKEGRQKNRRVEFNITFEEVHIETVLEHADEHPVDEAAPQTEGESAPQAE